MGGFCKHCGRELNGDEPYCPECGMPTGSDRPQSYPVAAPRKNEVKIAVIIVAAVVVLCFVGIAMLPSLITTSDEKYTMTVSIDDFAVYLDDTTQYTDIASNCEVILSISYDFAGKTVSEELPLDRHYVLNKGITPSTAKHSVKITGDPKDVKITAFLMIRGPGWSSGSSAFYDYIDIYSVDKSKITSGSSLYYGDSGITFSMEDLDKDGKLRIEGDSDPRGVVDLTVTTVKIQ